VGPFHNGFEPIASRRSFITFYRNHANRASRDRTAWCLHTVVESKLIKLDPKIRQHCLNAFIDTDASPAVQPRATRKVSIANK
jgi:hypothetical protein